MTQELQQLAFLVKDFLEVQAPILSSNLFRCITKAQLVNVSDNEITFCIDAPFYDMKLWKEKGVIVHTNASPKKWPDITDYAMWLNDAGAFGTHNRSMHWVNRVCYAAAHVIPNAEVINKLEL